MKAKEALVIIDVQNDFCHEDGAVGKRGIDMSSLQNVVGPIGRLAEAARHASVPVIFVQTEHSDWTNSAVWIGRVKGEHNVQRVPICAPGTWGMEYYGVKPKDGDRVVTKHRYSSFVGTDLELILRALGVEHVVLTGVLTNVCVESTARDAFMRDFQVTVIADACGAPTQLEHEQALFNVDTYFGQVADSDTWVQQWKARAA